MKKYLRYIAPIIFIVIINSCNKNEENKLQEEEIDVRTGFEENIKVIMNEKVDSLNKVLNLNCYTETIYGCANYVIESTDSIKDKKITINFIRIITPNICLLSSEPASKIISFTGLSNNTYELEINFGTSKVSGQLSVTTSSIIVTIPTQSKIQFINPDLKRIPNNTIYGTIHYDSASTSSLAQKFIDTLQLYGATPTLYLPGDYGQFEIDANGEIKQTPNDNHYFTRHYIFNYTNSSGQLRDLVKRFGINYPDLLSVILNTTKGESFYSWIQ